MKCQSPINGKILVTGGLGAIGIVLVKTIVDSGRDVIVYDWKKSNASQIPVTGAELLNGDICDERLLLNLFHKENISGIVHLAAISQVGTSERGYGALCARVNAGGTLSLMKAIDGSGIKPWFVNCSSREVYGEPGYTPVPESYPFNPLNKYGITKVVAEKIVSYYTTALNLNAVTLRPSNIYGSIYDVPGRLIPKFIQKALAGIPLEVYGGGQVLDLMHVSDAVDGLIRTISMLEHMDDEGYYEVFNLATGKPHSLQEVISLISLYAGREVETIYSEPRPFDVQHFVGDTKKAAQKLGFKSRVPLEEGISMTMDLYRKYIHAPDMDARALYEISACKEVVN